MAVADEIEPYHDPADNAEDLGLTDRQVAALEWLDKHGAAPAEIDPETGKSIYDRNSQVRAYQMIAEGRFGGPGRGQGRKPTRQRASEDVAEHVRERLTGKIKKALERGLDAESEKVAVDTAMRALEIERKERELQLQEQKLEHDLEQDSKEDLLEALIALAADPQIEAAIEERFIELPASAVTEISHEEYDRDFVAGTTDATDSQRATSIGEVGTNGGPIAENGRGRTTPIRPTPANPFTQAARRRPAD